MLNVPDKNIIEATDVTKKQMNDMFEYIQNQIHPRTRALSTNTGIFGEKNFIKGLPWDRVK